MELDSICTYIASLALKYQDNFKEFVGASQPIAAAIASLALKYQENFIK